YNHPPTLDSYTLSLHDALPISLECTGCEVRSTKQSVNEVRPGLKMGDEQTSPGAGAMSLSVTRSLHRRWPSGMRRTSEKFLFPRSEEHTSELQSLTNLVCRLLL